MRNYALTSGSAVKQRTNRQETTNSPTWHDARNDLSETAPDICRKSHLASSEVSKVNESEEDVDTAESHPENVNVELAEYDSSTDEEARGLSLRNDTNNVIRSQLRRKTVGTPTKSKSTQTNLAICHNIPLICE